MNNAETKAVLTETQKAVLTALLGGSVLYCSGAGPGTLTHDSGVSETIPGPEMLGLIKLGLIGHRTGKRVWEISNRGRELLAREDREPPTMREALDMLMEAIKANPPAPPEDPPEAPETVGELANDLIAMLEGFYYREGSGVTSDFRQGTYSAVFTLTVRGRRFRIRVDNLPSQG